MRPFRILDLCCGAGGIARGYADAGFEVVGVDIEAQPRFPYEFIKADAFTLDPDFIRSFNAIHSSPPCQGYSALKSAPNAKEHPKLIAPMRRLLASSGLPYVIENVEGAKAHLRDPILLCGSHFGLGAAGHQLRRHRLFECSFTVAHKACRHRSPVIGVYGGHVRNRGASTGGRGTRDFVGEDKPSLAREAMGISWMSMEEVSQAVPPAFSRYIGGYLRKHLEQRAAA